MPPLRIGVLAYPGCFASEVFGIPDVLAIASRVAAADGAPPPFECRIVSPRATVPASSGVPLPVRPMSPVDLLVVPGFEAADPRGAAATVSGLAVELGVVRDHRARGLPLVSVCVGAFLLAEAGLLDGRRATTSWLFAAALARAYPAVRVCPEHLVVTDAGVTTAAAYSAMYDVALDLVARHCGSRVATLTARLTLLDATRTAQTPYVDDRLLATPGSGLAATASRWLEQHLHEPYDLDRLAAACQVSTRTLLRRFKEQTGTTPREHLTAARVRRARTLLEHTERPLGEVQRLVGYQDPGAFRSVFRRAVGLSPRDYRAAFRRRARPGDTAPRSGRHPRDIPAGYHVPS